MELILYHGSSNKFEQFNNTIKYDKPTFNWFSDNKEFVEDYFDEDVGYLYTVKANLKNTIDLRAIPLPSRITFYRDGKVYGTKELKQFFELLGETDTAKIWAFVKNISKKYHIDIHEMYLFDIVKVPEIRQLLSPTCESLICTDLSGHNEKVTTYGILNSSDITILSVEKICDTYEVNEDVSLDKDGNFVSDIDANFKMGENYRLFDFDFKKVVPKMYKSIEEQSFANTDDFKDEYAVSWWDGDKLVAIVSEFDDAYGKRWLSYIEVTESYRGHNLSNELLNYAVNGLGCTMLGVAKSNKVAIKVYQDYGFKIIGENPNNRNQYWMEIMHTLKEDTRTQLTSKSRNADNYKNPIRGKNRWERKKYSKVATQVKSYNNINMNDFFKKDLLTINIPVTGETNSYDVTFQLDGVMSELARNVKSNKNIFEYRSVVQALTKVFNTVDIKVKCTCNDFKYRYQHQLIINNNNVDGTDKDPGPGRTGMANTSGKGCKHVLLALANLDWVMKVASCIKNYISYMDENKHQLFIKVIFPKLYGITADEAVEKGIVPEDTNLETDKNTIETINDWAKNRGKMKPGTNINPATGKGKIKNDTEKENKEEN